MTLLFITINCNKIPDNSPADEMSIETAEGKVGDKVLIRLKPKVGSTQNMIVILDMTAEDSNEVNIKMNSKVDMSVINQEDSVFTYEMRYKSLKMNVQTGAIEIKYDSDSKDNNPAASMLGGQMSVLIDNPILMKMDQMGRILDFQMPGKFTKDQTGDLGSIAIPLPENAVGIGDSWEANRSVEGFGNMKMKMTLQKITLDYVQIKVDGVFENNTESNQNKFNGEYKLDRKTGFTKDGVMNMKVDKAGKKFKMKIEFKSV